jgi:hypothetical protein
MAYKHEIRKEQTFSVPALKDLRACSRSDCVRSPVPQMVCQMCVCVCVCVYYEREQPLKSFRAFCVRAVTCASDGVSVDTLDICCL